MTIESDVRFFNGLLRRKRVDLDAAISTCGLIDRQRNRGDRHAHAHVSHTKDVICCSSLLGRLRSRSTRRGVLAHEIGHMLLLKRGHTNHREWEADEEVKRVLGLTIKYKRGLQSL
jgi:hypothetical protein